MDSCRARNSMHMVGCVCAMGRCGFGNMNAPSEDKYLSSPNEQSKCAAAKSVPQYAQELCARRAFEQVWRGRHPVWVESIGVRSLVAGGV